MPDNPGKTLLEKARKKMVGQMIELDMPAKREKFKGLFDHENHAGKDENINIENILTYVDAYNTGSDPRDLRNLMNEENRYYDNLSDDLKKKHIDKVIPKDKPFNPSMTLNECETPVVANIVKNIAIGDNIKSWSISKTSTLFNHVSSKKIAIIEDREAPNNR